MLLFRPLARRSIAAVWSGQLLATTGTEFYLVAVLWTATAAVGRDAGYVSAAQSAALLAGSLLGGSVTDRWRIDALMVGANLARAVLLLALAALAFAGYMSLPLLVCVAVLVAFATATFEPALQSAVPTLAPDPALRHVTNGLFDGTRRLARVIGPGLIAVAGRVMPVTGFFAVTGAVLLVSALCIAAGLRQVALPAPRPAGGLAGVADALSGGVRAVRHHPLLRYTLVAILVGNVAWSVGVILGMALHMQSTRADPLAAFAATMTAYGAGNLVASLALTSLPMRRPALWIVASKLIFGAGVIVLALAPNDGTLFAAAFFAALNGPLETLAFLHVMQRDVPTERLSQVYRLQMGAIFGGTLLANAAAPTLFAGLGTTVTIVAAGSAVVAAGLAGLPFAVAERRGGGVTDATRRA